MIIVPMVSTVSLLVSHPATSLWMVVAQKVIYDCCLKDSNFIYRYETCKHKKILSGSIKVIKQKKPLYRIVCIRI